MESQHNLVRFLFLFLIACAKLFSTPSLSNADNVTLKYLLDKPVNVLTFGIDSLENDLRLGYLETCARSNCREQHRNTSVSYLLSPPDWWATLSTPWPPDGIIVISVKTTRFGADNSMATEEGCRLGLSSMESANGGTNTPWMNYARFFIPRDDWFILWLDKKQDSDTLEQMKIISSRIVLINTETYEWRRPPAGIPYRTISVGCAGVLTDTNFRNLDEFSIIGNHKWP